MKSVSFRIKQIDSELKSYNEELSTNPPESRIIELLGFIRDLCREKYNIMYGANNG